MIRILLFIKHKCSFMWKIVEWINSLLFYVMYKYKLNSIENIIDESNQNTRYKIVLLKKEDMQFLSDFFLRQPEYYYKFFKPHNFDKKSLIKKSKDKSFIMLGVIDKNQLVGYGFLRCFFNGKAFRGKIVDINRQGNGIAKLLGTVMSSIAEALNLRLFATISKDNVKSIASSKAVNNIRIIKELPDNYLYVEYLRK